MGLDTVELVIVVEDHFEIRINNAAAAGLYTVGRLHDFRQRNFCVTGDFAYGPRDRVIQTIEERGGRIVGAPSGKTDFLIVGVTASAAWKHSTHGTKILRAIELREAGKPIAIIGEEHWTAYL